ncbi:MAG: hypothetical protein LQ343_007931 [Gyalolechia ehrenbergii]|nr:MAG: hypothetical protein LQ343_007931 [Gyalolechia ehrenbergii]
MSLKSSVVAIRGSNQGLAFLIPGFLSQQGKRHTIIAKGAGAVASWFDKGCPVDAISLIQLDSTKDEVKYVESEHSRLDILINHAGISPDTANIGEQLRGAFKTNTTGAVATTDAFLPLLRKSASPHVVYMTSGLGSLTLAANPKQLLYMRDATTYRATKAALDTLVVQQHKFLGKEGIKVWAVDLAFRITNLSSAKERAAKAGAGDPEGGAQVAADGVCWEAGSEE